ncbi:hypothetical protein [Lysobacter brunescens]|uniref:Uncharacterized protein n=1 Tax=Lysobacter brunescens TaxID=262323 RepID=A0ABW2YEB8_9GAMM
MHDSMKEFLAWINTNEIPPRVSALFMMNYLIDHGSAEEYPLVPVEIKDEINRIVDIYLTGDRVVTAGGGNRTDITELVGSAARILGRA